VLQTGPPEEFVASFKEAFKTNDELPAVVHKAHDDLHPLRARQLLERIPDEDCELCAKPPTSTFRNHRAPGFSSTDFTDFRGRWVTLQAGYASGLRAA
jgi:hypothetical protein